MKLLGSLRCFDNKECATDEKQSIPSCQFSNSQLCYAAPQGGPLTIAANVGGSLGGTSPPLPMWAPPGGGHFLQSRSKPTGAHRCNLLKHRGLWEHPKKKLIPGTPQSQGLCTQNKFPVEARDQRHCSHFGSRYTLGCCRPAGLFVYLLACCNEKVDDSTKRCIAHCNTRKNRCVIGHMV